MPEPLMRGDQTLHVLPARPIRCERLARQHHFQNAQQLVGNLKIPLVACLVERDEDLVRQPTRVAYRGCGLGRFFPD